MSTAPHPRVLHVAQPVTAGVAVAVTGYVRMLAGHGWDAVVACPSGGELSRSVEDAGARWVRWDATRSPGPSAAGESRALARILDEVRPDVVHLHSSKAGLAGRLLRGTGAPVVFTPHAWSWLGARGPVSLAARRWERLAAPRTSAVLCCGADEAQAGRAAGLRTPRWEVLTNVVDPGELPPADRSAARVALGIDPVRPVVVCPARVSHQKGQDVLFAAWRDLGADADLVLVGSTAGADGILAQAPPGTTVVTPRSRREVLLWCAAADLVVAPSRYEGLSLGVLEAAAMGAPVVASDVGGMREALVGAPALLCPSGDAAALAAALADGLARREELASAAASSAIAIRARLLGSWTVGADRLDRLYRELMTAHAARVPSVGASSRPPTTVPTTTPGSSNDTGRLVPTSPAGAPRVGVDSLAPASVGGVIPGGSR